MTFSVDARGLVELNGKVLLLPTTVIPKFKAIVEYLAPLIDLHSRRSGVPRSWIAGIIWAETGFLGPKGGARGLSHVGATGRMQLMPFWYTKPSIIGDGKAHTQEEMFDDRLNMHFGTDLLARIRNEGNNLPQTASIYNCGQQPGSKPMRPKPAPTQNPRWGICAASDYIDNVSAANNVYILELSPTYSAPLFTPRRVAAGAIAAAGAALVAKYLFR